MPRDSSGSASLPFSQELLVAAAPSARVVAYFYVGGLNTEIVSDSLFIDTGNVCREEVSVHACVCVCVCMCAHVCMLLCVCMVMCVCACMHVCMFMYVYVHTCMCMFICFVCLRDGKLEIGMGGRE